MPGRILTSGAEPPEKDEHGKELDDFPPGDVSGATGIATTGSVAGGLEQCTAGDAGADLDFDRGKIRQTSCVVLQLDVLDHRRRKTLDFVGLKFPLDFLRHQQVPLYT
jgi:hypothetical protein